MSSDICSIFICIQSVCVYQLHVFFCFASLCFVRSNLCQSIWIRHEYLPFIVVFWEKFEFFPIKILNWHFFLHMHYDLLNCLSIKPCAIFSLNTDWARHHFQYFQPIGLSNRAKMPFYITDRKFDDYLKQKKTRKKSVWVYFVSWSS